MATNGTIDQPHGAGTPEFEAACAALAAGELVVYPTETLYALGADARNPQALARLIALKGREPGKPIALIAADLAMVMELVQSFPTPALRLAQRFWPGPLTLVLPARAGLSEVLLNDSGGVGVRVPDHWIACQLSARLGSPLTATSANLAGGVPATTVKAARAALGDAVAAYLEGGELGRQAASTVVDFQGQRPRVLRAGPIDEAQLYAALGQ
jgi:L-threonylcarbamoyladenylate synthase